MNNDAMWALAISGLLNFIALTFLAIRLRAPVQITLPSITVQSPHAVLPPELMDTLQRVNEKLSPPTTPAEVDQLEQLVTRGVELAAAAHGLKGPDKFRTARDFVMLKATEQHLEIDARSLALSIESAVAMRRAQKLLTK